MAKANQATAKYAVVAGATTPAAAIAGQISLFNEDGTPFTGVPATLTTTGTVKKGAAVVNATDAATALTQLNALLVSLRAAGVIA